MVADPLREFREWAQKYQALVNHDHCARRSWERLSDLSFSDELISLGFYLACDFPKSPGYSWQGGKGEARRTLARVKQLQSRIVSVRKEFCDVLGIEPSLLEFDLENERIAKLADIGRNCEATEGELGEPFEGAKDWNPKPDDSEPTIYLLCEVREDSGIEFEDWNIVDAKDRKVIEGFELAFERLCQCQKKLENATSNRRYSPAFYLSLGLHLIRSRSDKSFYRDYANLLNCAYQAFSREDIECGEEAVRKTYQRFIKRNPEAFSFAIAPGVAVSLSMIQTRAIDSAFCSADKSS
jgi:hypothetical protein